MTLNELSTLVTAELPAEPRPQTGDVVVGCAGPSPDRHVLGVVSRPFQISCKTRRDALARATTFASTRRVDVWMADDGDGFTLIARYRDARARPAQA